MEMVHVIDAPPPNVVGGICISQNKCFRLDVPKNKAPSPLSVKLRTNYHVNRMRMHAESARDPDMNMSIKEIRDGVKVSDRVRLSLTVYGLGVLAILFILGG